MTALRNTLGYGLRLLRIDVASRAFPTAAAAASSAATGSAYIASTLTGPLRSSRFLIQRSTSTTTSGATFARSLAFSPGGALVNPRGGSADTTDARLSKAPGHTTEETNVRPAGILAELRTNPQPMGQPSTHTTAKSMGSRLLRPRRYFAIKTHVSIGTCSKSYGSPNKALVRVEVQDATPGGEARNWVIRTPKQGVHWNKDPADRGGVTREEAETRGVSLEEFFRQLNLFLLESCGTDELPLVVVWDGSDMLLLDKATQKEGPAAAAAAEQLARVPVVQLETWWAESKSSKHPSIGVSPRQLKPRGLVYWVDHLHKAGITGKRTKGAHHRPETTIPTAAWVALLYRQTVQFKQESPSFCIKAKGNPRLLRALLTNSSDSGSSSRKGRRSRKGGKVHSQ